MAEEEAAGEEAAEPKPSKLPVLVAILNTVALLGVLGMLVYVKILFKRPEITEEAERTRLVKENEEAPKAVLPGAVDFKKFTVNIQPRPGGLRPASGAPGDIQGKLHYATLGFSLEIRDSEKKTKVEEIRPVFMDLLIRSLGKKSFDQLVTVQGRYLLRSEIIEMANALVKEPLVLNVFFTEFIVQ